LASVTPLPPKQGLPQTRTGQGVWLAEEKARIYVVKSGLLLFPGWASLKDPVVLFSIFQSLSLCVVKV
jgi:hypothetical protein